MLELPDGTILLKAGEPLPAWCVDCDLLYPVEADTHSSRCPLCCRIVVHDEFGWRRLECEHTEETDDAA